MKSFFNEFKEFISRGNVMSMAIGIIIGSAFTAIVNSVVKDIITPLIGAIAGGVNFTGIVITIGESSILVGNFLQAVFNFLIITMVIFMTTKAFNKMNRKKEQAEEAAKEEAPKIPEDIKLLSEIRDLLKNNELN